MTYAEKLRDPRWQRKRLEVLERDGWKCRDCGEQSRELHVHHTKYEKGEPWDIHPFYLLALCDNCHERRGVAERKLKNQLADCFVLYRLDYIENVAAGVMKFARSK